MRPVTDGTERLHLLRRVPRSPWGIAIVFSAVWVAIVMPWSQPLQYDEAVFVSRTGGLDGTHPPKWGLAASREHGTSALLHIVRLFGGSGLASLRIVWGVVMLALVVAAFGLTARHLGRAAAVIAMVLLSTTWVPLTFFGTFYGSFVSALGALIATSVYLSLRKAGADRYDLAIALGLGMALSAWFRTLEPLVAALVIAGHALVWQPRWLLRRWRSIATAIATVIVAFVIPWFIVTIHEWGSLHAWWHSARNQGAAVGRHGQSFGLRNHVLDYARLFLGHGTHFSVFPDKPHPGAWAVVFASIGILVLGAATVIVGLRVVIRIVRRRVTQDDSALTLYLAQALAGFGLFFFVVHDLQERYLLFGAVFGSCVAGAALTSLAPSVRGLRSTPRRAAALVLGVVALGWLCSQAALARDVEHSRATYYGRWDRLGTAIRVIADGRPCVILGQAARPNVQLTSGCTHLGFWQTAAQLTGPLRNHRWRPGTSVFVLWRPGIDVVTFPEPPWQHVDIRGSQQTLVLSYRIGSLRGHRP